MCIRDRFRGYVRHESIFAVNRLAEQLTEEDVDLDKLTALVKYAEDDSLSTAVMLAKQIEDFGYIAKADGYEEVGRYLVEYTSDYVVSPELMDFVDYEGFGAYKAGARSGKFIDGGFVYIEQGETLQEVLDRTEEHFERQYDMKMGGI